MRAGLRRRDQHIKALGHEAQHALGRQHCTVPEGRAHGGRRPRKGNREEVGHAVKGPKDLGRLGCGLLLGAEGAGWGGLLAEVRKRVS